MLAGLRLKSVDRAGVEAIGRSRDGFVGNAGREPDRGVNRAEIDLVDDSVRRCREAG